MIKSANMNAQNFVYLIYLFMAFGTNAEEDDAPITYNMRYSDFHEIGASWSGTGRHSDVSISHSVAHWRNHAATIDAFIDKYPLVQIETTGKAVSESTIGDVGKGHFGTITFDTRHFKHPDWYTEYVVYSRQNAFWWDVGVEIGFQFKNEGEFLYLRATVNGWIYSGGHVWRYLDLGLGATRVTFHPNH